jgi:hypothetical protein
VNFSNNGVEGEVFAGRNRLIRLRFEPRLQDADCVRSTPQPACMMRIVCNAGSSTGRTYLTSSSLRPFLVDFLAGKVAAPRCNSDRAMGDLKLGGPLQMPDDGGPRGDVRFSVGVRRHFDLFERLLHPRRSMHWMTSRISSSSQEIRTEFRYTTWRKLPDIDGWSAGRCILHLNKSTEGSPETGSAIQKLFVTALDRRNAALASLRDRLSW